MNRPNEAQENPNLRRQPLRGPAQATPPRRMGAVDMPNLRRGPESTPAARYPEGRRLVVGRDITLAGQISKCDFLIVEGSVEGMRYEGQSLELAESGSFSGNIDVDRAEISGSFDGTMTVKSRLTIRPTGRVNGNIRYGEVEIAAGGHLTGDIAVIEKPQVQTAASNQITPQEPAPGDSVFTLGERLAGE